MTDNFMNKIMRQLTHVSIVGNIYDQNWVRFGFVHFGWVRFGFVHHNGNYL